MDKVLDAERAKASDKIKYLERQIKVLEGQIKEYSQNHRPESVETMLADKNQ